MRWKERRGEKEFRGWGVERRDFIFSRVAGWKVEGELRFVMRRVLEGSRGVMRGGRSERSRERGSVGGGSWDGVWERGVCEGDAGGD